MHFPKKSKQQICFYKSKMLFMNRLCLRLSCAKQTQRSESGSGFLCHVWMAEQPNFHITYSHSTFLRTQVCSFGQFPHSLFPCISRAALFPSLCSQSQNTRGHPTCLGVQTELTGLPSAQSSSAGTCWSCWSEGVTTWGQVSTRPRWSCSGDAAPAPQPCPELCQQPGTISRQSDPLGQWLGLLISLLYQFLCLSALINEWEPVKAAQQSNSVSGVTPSVAEDTHTAPGFSPVGLIWIPFIEALIDSFHLKMGAPQHTLRPRPSCDLFPLFTGTSWTVIQRRVDGSLDFNQTWDAYTNGFGDLNGKYPFFCVSWYQLIWEDESPYGKESRLNLQTTANLLEIPESAN